MADRRRLMSWTGISVIGGVLLVTLVTNGRRPALLAGGGDHPDAPMALTVTVSTESNGKGVTITNDGVVFLNYAKALLMAAVPLPIQSGTTTRILSDLAERDLVRDFGLSLGTTPHFTMITGRLGAMSEGWAPLYIFES